LCYTFGMSGFVKNTSLEFKRMEPKDYDHKRASVYFSNKSLAIIKKIKKEAKSTRGIELKTSGIIRDALKFYFENSNDIPTTLS